MDFSVVAKDDPRDRIEVEIGDAKQVDFYPQVKVMRWDNEVNLSVRLVDDQVAAENVSTSEGKIVWTKGSIEANFYEVPPSKEHPEGGYEFEVVLKEKPKSNRLSFTLNTKGLDFLYQRPFTERYKDGYNEEFGEDIVVSETQVVSEHGAVLDSGPERVIGSYAIYCSEDKTNYEDGKLYRVGKVGQIYRPRIIDATGNETWGELGIDVEAGILSVTIPQKFLDEATYPIRHAAGLTFGYESVGLLTVTTNGRQRMKVNAPASSGTATDIRAYLSAVVENCKAALYVSSTSALMSPQTEEIASVAAGWNTFNFTAGPSVVASTNYLIAVMLNTTDMNYDDGGVSGNSVWTSKSYGAWDDPVLKTATTSIYSIYCTYTPAASQIKKASGVAQASISKVSGMANANVKKLAGVSNT